MNLTIDPSQTRSQPFVPIAVVGMSAIFPGSGDLSGYWRDIAFGQDRISDVPERYWLTSDHYDPDPAAHDKTYAKRGGFLSGVDFDPLRFGLPPKTLEGTDVAQLLALVAAERVLEDASHAFRSVSKDRTSVILGVASALQLAISMGARQQRPIWLKALREAGVGETLAQDVCDRIAAHYPDWQESTFPGLISNVVAGRIANRFDLGGTNCTTDAACASSLSALAMGMSELTLGHSDLVIVGGVDASNAPYMFLCFSKTPALSRSGDIRPFADDADGTLLGEGVGMVALKRLAEAERDGDPIYAVIRGLGSSSDGRGKSIYAPSHAGQTKALHRAYERAGYSPATVELVEAHGTGTTAGDHAEFEGLCSAFADSGRTDRQWCALGSVKAQIGHTKAAAGAASLIKVIAALQARVIPQTLKAERPASDLRIEESPFYLATRVRPWIRSSAHPRRAGVSSFGFGGSNFHVTVEEYRGDHVAKRLRAFPCELLVFGASDRAGLVKALEACKVSLLARRAATPAADDDKGLDLLAYESQRRFESGSKHRLALVAADLNELQAKLERAIRGLDTAVQAGVHYGEGHESGGLAFVFPGRGSEYVDMGADLAMAWGQALDPWDVAASLPESEALPAIVFPRTARTDHERRTQSALLAEPQWAQAAIGVDALGKLALLQSLGVTPDAVAGHGDGDVIALHAAGVFDRSTMIRVAQRRGEVIRTPEARSGLLECVAGATLRSPSIPVFVNAGTDAHSSDVEVIRRRLVEPEASPVHFVEQIRAMYQAGLRTFVEVGPGSVLTDLVGQILAGKPHHAVALDDRRGHGLRAWLEALARMIAFGVPVELGGLWQEYRLPVAPTVAQSSVVPVTLTGRNPGDAYPPAGGAASLPGPNPDPVPEPFAFASVPVAVESRGLALAPSEAANRGDDVTAEVHAAWIRAMTDTHLEFLRAAPRTMESPTEGVISHAPARIHAKEPRAAVPTERALTASELISLGAELWGGDDPAESTLSAPAPRASAIVLSIVAEKTGYPPESLDLDMNLEADLGIDSIKKVEILSAVAENMGESPALDVRALAELQTLAQVIGHFEARGAPSPVEDWRSELLAIVAEKTGYPVASIGLHMSLESDLGIDSIKRVEILSAFSERVPGLPSLDARAIGELTTLAEILAFVEAEATKPASDEAPLQPRIRLERHVVDLVATGLPNSPLPGLDAGPIVVLGGPQGLAEAVAVHLGRAGLEVRARGWVTDDVSGVVFLGGLGVEDPDRIHFAAFSAAKQLAAAKAPRAFVTVQDTGGDFGQSGSDRAWYGGLSGLIKTAALEWPQVATKAIDLEKGSRSQDDLARAIAVELTQGGADQEVALSPTGHRSVLRSRRTRSRANTINLPLRPVVVASGGGRGITAACMLALARVVKARVVLLGRTPVQDEPIDTRAARDDAELKRVLFERAAKAGRQPSPLEIRQEVARILANREIRATQAAIQAAGGEAVYYPLDITDTAQVEQALDATRKAWGPITGLVHGAGVLADRRIADKTIEEFTRVYATKVVGLRTLLAATESDPLEMIAVFSSVVARVGNAGQSDYAVANEILNQVARAEARRRGPACTVKAFDWGPWDGGMVTPALKRHFEGRGIPLIVPEEGADFFINELFGDDSTVEVVVGSSPAVFGSQAISEWDAVARPSERRMPSGSAI